MKSEFALAFNEVIEDKGLPREVVLEALQAALVSAYRRSVNASNAQHIEAVVDSETGGVEIFAEKEIVDEVQDDRTEVTLEKAKTVDPEAELGQMIIIESTPDDFGRVAAQTARQVIQQRIREAERQAQFDYYSPQEGEIVSGVIQAINNQNVTLGLEIKAEGQMPRSQQIPGEYFRVHDRIRALLLEVRMTPRGPQIILSRAHRDFLRRLLENEVPEIYHGMVEIRSISREPGQRSKVAVAALQPGVDPVGACVGIRGVRIQAIVRELNDEKIDVIEYSSDASVYIAKALSPARVTGVYLNESEKGPKTATVVVPEDQLSLAIGRDGQNARLAAKLTGWRIDIKSLPEAASEVLYKFENDPEYGDFALEETEVAAQVEASLAKKAEGRPVNPEDYQVMAHFVDRVEGGVIQRRTMIKQQEERRVKEAREGVPKDAFELPLLILGLPEEPTETLTDAGYKTVGELMVQINLDVAELLKVDAVDETVIEQAIQSIEALDLEVVEEVEEILEEAVAELEAEETEPEQEEESIAEAEPVSEVIDSEVDEDEIEAEEEILEPEAEPAAEEETELELEEEAPSEEEEAQEEPADEEEHFEEMAETDEDLFKLRPELMTDEDLAYDFELQDTGDPDKKPGKGKKKSKKKQKRFVEVEYDPDQDITVYKKKKKRKSDWDEDWEEEW